MSSPSAPVSGRIGRYVDLQLLGQGGMGAVYRGRDPELDRPVAIKVMLDATPDFVARFRREAQAIAKLVHPNIVQVYDFGVDEEGNPYFVMELIEGTPLDKRIRGEGHLPVGEALRLAKQAAEGLAAAHRAGIVHRDVKPSNLILDRRGMLKLVDFGIARVAQPTQGGQPLTNAAALMGTPGYMAPEQAAGGKPVDGRADVYSLALTLFEMLSGQAPYEAEDPISLIVKNMREPLPDLRIRGLGLPEDVVALVEQMSAKDPDQRIQSMDAVAAAIGELLTKLGTGQFSVAPPPSGPAWSPSSGGSVPPTNVHGGSAVAAAAGPASNGGAAKGPPTLLFAGLGIALAGLGVGAFLLLRTPAPKDPPPDPSKLAENKLPPPDPTGAPPNPGTTGAPPNAGNQGGTQGVTKMADTSMLGGNTGGKTTVVDRPGGGSKDGPLRVAVLKFKNLSGNKLLDQLEQGMGETMQDQLHLPNVKVFARADIDSEVQEIDRAADFHWDAQSVAKLGQLKGVEVAVQGAVQAFKGESRVTARLVRVETGEILETATVTMKGADPLKLEDKVSSAMAQKLKVVVEKEGRK